MLHLITMTPDVFWPGTIVLSIAVLLGALLAYEPTVTNGYSGTMGRRRAIFWGVTLGIIAMIFIVPLVFGVGGLLAIAVALLVLVIVGLISALASL